MRIARNSRKDIRFRIIALLKFSTDPHLKYHHATNISDISKGGLSFLVDLKLNKGAELKLSFLLPSRKNPVEASGTVAYCRQEWKGVSAYRIGVKLVNMSEQEKLTFCDLLDRFLEIRKEMGESLSFPVVLRQHD